MKIFLATKNSNWGSTNNTSLNVLSFDNLNLRNQFILDQFGFNILTDFEKLDDKLQQTVTSTTISFKVHTSELEISFANLLNMNYAITKNDEGDIMFWNVQGSNDRSNNNMVNFSGTLDVFTTYPLQDLFLPNGKTIVKTAHYDRFNKDQSINIDINSPNATYEKISQSISESNMFQMDTKNIEFDFRYWMNGDESITDRQKINDYLNNAGYTVFFCSKIPVQLRTDNEEKVSPIHETRQNSFYDGNNWTYVTENDNLYYFWTSFGSFLNTGSGDPFPEPISRNSPIITNYNTLYHSGSYNGSTIYFRPYLVLGFMNNTVREMDIVDYGYNWPKAPFLNIGKVLYDNVDDYISNTSQIIKTLEYSPYLIGGGTIKTVFPIFPIKPNQQDFIITLKDDGVKIQSKANARLLDNTDPTGIYACPVVTSKGLKADEPSYQNIQYKSLMFIVNNTVNIINSINYNLLPDIKPNLDINGNYNWKEESKIYTSKYQHWKIQNQNADYILAPELMQGDIYFECIETYSPTVSNIIVKPHWLDKSNKEIYNFDYNQKMFFQDVTSKYNPTSEQAFTDYMTSNSSQFNAWNSINRRNADINQAQSVLGIIGSVLGVGDNIVGNASSLANTKKMSGLNITQASSSIAGGVLGGLSGVISGYQEYYNSQNAVVLQTSQVSDLKNSPDKYTGVSSDIDFYTITDSLKPRLNFLKLWDRDLEMIATHFYKFGVTYPQKLYNIYSIIDTRYYFNFIITEDIYAIIKETFSPELKSFINELFMNGIRIWHYRNKDTFKGVANYNVNNIEMNLLT